MYKSKINTDEDNTYFFALNTNLTKNVRGRVRAEVVKGEGPGINQVIPVLNHLSVPDCGFNALLVPALKLRPSLNYAKQKIKEFVAINSKYGKTETTGRNTDTPKVGVPYRRSNLGISPQSLLD